MNSDACSFVLSWAPGLAVYRDGKAKQPSRGLCGCWSWPRCQRRTTLAERRARYLRPLRDAEREALSEAMVGPTDYFGDLVQAAEHAYTIEFGAACAQNGGRPVPVLV